MKKKVLLVEDDDSICRLLKTLLEIEGFEVSTSDGEVKQVPELLQLFQPDFLILDYYLKKSTGIDVLRLFGKDSNYHRPFILVTSGEDQQERCMREGADGFLLKPYMPDDMIDWLHEKELVIDQRKD